MVIAVALVAALALVPIVTNGFHCQDATQALGPVQGGEGIASASEVVSGQR